MKSVDFISKEKLAEIKLQYPVSTKIRSTLCEDTVGIVCGTDSRGFLLVKWDNGNTNSIDPNTDIYVEEEKGKVWICSYYLEKDGDYTNITIWDNFNDAVSEMTKTLKEIYSKNFTINDFAEDPKAGYLLSPLDQNCSLAVNDYDRYAIIPYYRNSGKFIIP